MVHKDRFSNYIHKEFKVHTNADNNPTVPCQLQFPCKAHMSQPPDQQCPENMTVREHYNVEIVPMKCLKNIKDLYRDVERDLCYEF